MTKEAMKLALEALEALIKKTGGQSIYSFMETERRIAMAACVGLREALAEHNEFNPDWDAIAVMVEEQQRMAKRIEELEAQSEQEWKLVPVKPTEEMLKAMDECSTEGYDERLYAGHAASVYMAAVDVAPTPPQRKRLTHEQRVDLLAKFEAHKHEWHAPAILIDMVEAAHGIKE